ncbi:hypothetical protein JNJ66_07455 [Candidatus Saccharibacteria bacterium]|nr:hypothetical protein [Candidatus Saccharibacteria bacterium]
MPPPLEPRHPIYRHSLRALLRLIEKGQELQDSQFLRDTSDILDNLVYENYDNWTTYMSAIQDRVGNDEEDEMYVSDEEMSTARQSIDEQIFGDFDEAMITLEQDLRGLPWRDSLDSDAFKPDYFAADDRKIWDELREVAKRYIGVRDTDAAEAATEDAIVRLRRYLQKLYGPLIPVMIATYSKAENVRTVGYSVRLAWLDGKLDITTSAPFCAKFTNYVMKIKPITRPESFTAEHVPQKIDGFELGSVDCYQLFRYEL